MIKRIFGAALIACLTLPVGAQNQVPASSLFDNQNTKYENSIERFYQTRSITRTVSPQVLEGILDEIAYKIGPGDVFKMRIWGEIEVEFTQTVNPGGTVLVPTIGEIDVAGLNLRQARQKLHDAIAEKYVKSDFSVVLDQLRKFRVYLTGEVNMPGTFFAQASDRVSDVIEVARGVRDWGDDTRIEVRHRDGNMISVNLSDFYFSGKKSNNPYLQAGDVIHVPTIDFSQPVVIVEGSDRANQASYKSVYAIRPGEKLYAFLGRVGVLNKDSDLSSVILRREKKEIMLNLFDNSGAAADYQLQNGDHLQIPAVIREVYVQGAVANPGPYPYLANYTAKDYAGQAGAMDTGVEPDGYVVIRASTGESIEGADTIVKQGDTVLVPKRTREVLKDYLTVITPIASLVVTIAILLRQ